MHWKKLYPEWSSSCRALRGSDTGDKGGLNEVDNPEALIIRKAHSFA